MPPPSKKIIIVDVNNYLHITVQNQLLSSETYVTKANSYFQPFGSIYDDGGNYSWVIDRYEIVNTLNGNRIFITINELNNGTVVDDADEKITPSDFITLMTNETGVYK